ncbi:MAG: SWIM zinc finger family protein [Capsulimonadaceae bacterium]
MFTPEQVMALAPDAPSAKAGRDLANRRKWADLGRQDDTAVWGACQGSGSTPYQTRVDLREPAFKCSCPSRKFPCKHGLGLLYLLATDAGAVPVAEPPDWVATWLAGREARSEKKAAAAAPPAEGAAEATVVSAEAAEAAAAAAAKRVADCEERIAGGIDDLDRWLRDLVRRGLANIDLGYKYWDGQAARLVDAQAPGLARMVREMAGTPSSGAGWQERLLEQIGLLYLAVEGYRRKESLSDAARADLLSLVGWTVPQEQVLDGPGREDVWVVLGQHVEEEDRLQVQRTWLVGESSRQPALILQFAHGSRPLDPMAMIPGTAFSGELAFYPGACPLRALVRTRRDNGRPATVHGAARAAQALSGFGRALAAYPWLDRYPVVVERVRPAPSTSGWQVVDEHGDSLPLVREFAHGWRLMAVSGGHPVTMAGEWNGSSLLPLGVDAGGRYMALT